MSLPSSIPRPLHQKDAQPRHWFNEQRNPAIDLGLFAFPAHVLPVLVALIFLWTKPHRRFLQRLNRNPFEIRRGVLNQVHNNDRRGDFPRQLQGLLALFHMLCTRPALTQRTDFYKDDLLGYGAAEALSCLVAGVYLDTAMAVSYIATSAGWMLLAIDTRFFAAAGLLALPCAWQLLGNTGVAHWQSGILLLLLAVEYAELDLIHLPGDLSIQLIKHSTLAIYLPSLIVGASIKLFHTAAEQSSLEEAVNVIKVSLYDGCVQVVQALAGVAAFLSPIAINAAITGYLAACIGWRWIIFQRTANDLLSSRMGPVLWAMFYVALWCVVQFFTETRGPERLRDMLKVFRIEMVICADVTGLATVFIVLLWWTAIVLPHLHIII